MTIIQTVALLVTAAAAGACFNYSVLKLPSTIGLMVFALLLSCGGVILNAMGWVDLHNASSFVANLDFSNILLHGILSFLLFAGALHINLDELKRHRVIVAILATVSVVIATFVTGSLIWWASEWLNFNLSYIECLLFGSLIAPTDPVAVMGILKDINMSQDLRIKIGSESLLNDGIGVVVFLAMLNIANHPDLSIKPSHLAYLLLWESIGGIAMGLAIGWLGWQLLRKIDDYKVEVLVTLAICIGGYSLAEFARVSAPLTIVAAGLLIGNHGRMLGMSSHTRRHVDMFWELLDEILNAVLFMLIGLEMIVITFKPTQIPLGFIAIAATLIGRFVSVAVPIKLMHSNYGFGKGTITLLTWGGLRGGIAIALALSLPAMPHKDIILDMTYGTVLFSVLIQGTTFRSVARKVMSKSDTV